jgi:hypothetical protein
MFPGLSYYVNTLYKQIRKVPKSPDRFAEIFFHDYGCDLKLDSSATFEKMPDGRIFSASLRNGVRLNLFFNDESKEWNLGFSPEYIKKPCTPKEIACACAMPIMGPAKWTPIFKSSPDKYAIPEKIILPKPKKMIVKVIETEDIVNSRYYEYNPKIYALKSSPFIIGDVLLLQNNDSITEKSPTENGFFNYYNSMPVFFTKNWELDDRLHWINSSGRVCVIFQKRTTEAGYTYFEPTIFALPILSFHPDKIIPWLFDFVNNNLEPKSGRYYLKKYIEKPTLPNNVYIKFGENSEKQAITLNLVNKISNEQKIMPEFNFDKNQVILNVFKLPVELIFIGPPPEIDIFRKSKTHIRFGDNTQEEFFVTQEGKGPTFKCEVRDKYVYLEGEIENKDKYKDNTLAEDVQKYEYRKLGRFVDFWTQTFTLNVVLELKLNNLSSECIEKPESIKKAILTRDPINTNAHFKYPFFDFGKASISDDIVMDFDSNILKMAVRPDNVGVCIDITLKNGDENFEINYNVFCLQAVSNVLDYYLEDGKFSGKNLLFWTTKKLGDKDDDVQFMNLSYSVRNVLTRNIVQNALFVIVENGAKKKFRMEIANSLRGHVYTNGDRFKEAFNSLKNEFIDKFL